MAEQALDRLIGAFDSRNEDNFRRIIGERQVREALNRGAGIPVIHHIMDDNENPNNPDEIESRKYFIDAILERTPSTHQIYVDLFKNMARRGYLDMLLLHAFKNRNEEEFFQLLQSREISDIIKRDVGIELLEQILTFRPNRENQTFNDFKRQAIAYILRHTPSSDELYNYLVNIAAHRGDADLVHAFLLKGGRVSGRTFNEFSPATWNNPPRRENDPYNRRLRLGPNEMPAPHLVDLIMLAHELEEKGSSYKEYAENENNSQGMLRDALERLEMGQSGGRKRRKGRKGTRRHRIRRHRTRRHRR